MFNSINKKDWRLVVLSIVLSITSLSVCARDKLAFPLPNKLQADVRFWTKIYTEVTTSEGLIHDNKRLDIIYDRVTFKPGTSYKERQKIIKNKKNTTKECYWIWRLTRIKGLIVRDIGTLNRCGPQVLT